MPLRFVAGRRFFDDYADLPPEIQRRVDRALRRLAENPGHPSLRLRKMEGLPDIWEVRVTSAYRLTCRIEGDACILRRVGTHEIFRKP
ncbi:MAG: hypothetical protein FJX73_10805 [Armatimonadetes bacterium]|nr:hypothetical protein [Armatimonadota bacterium]